jgi:hypothetical protein
MDGGYSVTRDPRKELAVMLLNTMLTGKDSGGGYESDRSFMARFENHVNWMLETGDSEFVAKAMIYTRMTGNLRTISHHLAVLLAEHSGRMDSRYTKARAAIRKSINRVDDMTAIKSIWDRRHPDDFRMKQMGDMRKYSMMMPNPMRKAFADIMSGGRFDEYQYKKYMNGTDGVTVKDLVLACRPNPASLSDPTLFKRILDGKVGPIDTMQTMLSSGDGAGDAMGALLSSGKLGIMAALKNIRNALENGLSDDHLDLWCKLVSDRDAIMRGKVLPFRLFDAWDSIRGLAINGYKLDRVRNALNAGLSLSATNIELTGPDEKVAIILDESGSMRMAKIGNRWVFDVAAIITGCLLSGLNRANVQFYTFSTKCTNRTTLANLPPIQFASVIQCGGGGTNVAAPFQEMIRTGTKVDKVIILTDLQLYPNNKMEDYAGINRENLYKYYDQYADAVGGQPKILFWNLRAYPGGTPMAISDNVMEVVGFSENMFELIPKLWRDKDAIVHEIERVEI